MKKIKINVEGMTCEHCVESVNKAVNKVNGVIKVDTSLSKNDTSNILKNFLLCDNSSKICNDF